MNSCLCVFSVLVLPKLWKMFFPKPKTTCSVRVWHYSSGTLAHCDIVPRCCLFGQVCLNSASADTHTGLSVGRKIFHEIKIS